MAKVPTTRVLLGGSPGENFGEKALNALLRALRTLLQGIAGAFPAAGIGMEVLSKGYWETFAYSCLAAVIAAAVAFLQNVAVLLPDPGQQDPR